MATKGRARKKNTLYIWVQVAMVVLVLLLCGALVGKSLMDRAAAPQTDPSQSQGPDDGSESGTPPTETEGTTIPADTSPEGIKEAFLKEHNLTEDDYLPKMFEVYEYFPEVREFILNYPLMKDNYPTSSDISGYDRTNGIPLFIQWDPAWGYTPYGKGVCGTSACGAVCMSMVAYYLTGNTEYTPHYMMEFARKNGHMGSGGGTNWSMFSVGSTQLGFYVKEVGLDENVIRRKLEAGIPIVVNVGPGDFTRNGHYMVLSGYEDGKIRINDPFSVINSQKLWEFDRIKSQIKNLWEIRLPD